MIIIIELTKIQVEPKDKIKYSIVAINSIHFRCSTICHNIFGFDTHFVPKGQWYTYVPKNLNAFFSNKKWLDITETSKQGRIVVKYLKLKKKLTKKVFTATSQSHFYSEQKQQKMLNFSLEKKSVQFSFLLFLLRHINKITKC